MSNYQETYGFNSKPKHQHKEAYCLMEYVSDDGNVVEMLWNSRDGVTPFCTIAKDGVTEIRHTNWQRDRYAPDHIPMPGDRIFIDYTEEHAKAHAERMVELYWDAEPYPMSKRWKCKEAAIEELTDGYIKQYVSQRWPHTYTVPESGWNGKAGEHNG